MTSGYNPYTAGHGSPSYKRHRLWWTIGVIVACICLVVIYHDRRTDWCVEAAELSGGKANISYNLTPPFVTCEVTTGPESVISS